MKNVYSELKESYENVIKNNTAELNDLGFAAEDIKEMKKILRLENTVMFRENDKPIDFENGEKSFDNGYSNGLWKGASSQTKHIINILLEDKISSKIEANRDRADFLIRYLYFAENAKALFLDEYDINIALSFERVYAEYEADYYILIQKDNEDKEYDFTIIDEDKEEIKCDYKPNKYEMDEIQKYLSES